MARPSHPAINPRTGKRRANYDPAKARAAREAAAGELRSDVADIRRALSLAKRAEVAQMARERFMPFVKFTSPDPEDPGDVERSKYKNARHHDAIARVIEEVEKGEIKFLILTMPPRHGKSELVSRRFPAWYIGRHPNHAVVVATYSDTFAEDFGRDVRSIMRSPQYRQAFPEVVLARGGTAADRLNTTSGGQMSFVGRGGALTGRGAHLMIIDDLIKDDKEAQSQAVRDQAWNWFTKVAMTRRMGKKLVVMTFTRWHADDPIGRLTDPENPCFSPEISKGVKIINFPAIAEDDDPLGRAPGTPLWPDGPDQFDLDFLAQQRALDPVAFTALYQQRPSAMDGTMFRRDTLRFYKPHELPTDLRWYCASDHAVATGQRNDYTVLLKAGVDTQGNMWLVDCVWQRIASDVAVEYMLAMAGGERRPLLWWAERGHISKSIGPFLYKRLQETGTFLNIVEVTPVGDKAQRAQSIAARAAMGKLYLPEAAPWTDKAVDQMMAFPNGTHDDFVDALAYLGLGLQHQHPASAPVKRREPPKFGTLAWVKEHDAWHEEKRRAAAAGRF